MFMSKPYYLNGSNPKDGHCIPTLISIYRYSELRKSDCIEQHHARGTGRNVVLRVLALKFSPSSLLKLGIIHSL